MRSDDSSTFYRFYPVSQPITSVTESVPSCSSPAEVDDASVVFVGVERSHSNITLGESTTGNGKRRTSTICNYGVDQSNRCSSIGYKSTALGCDKQNKNDYNKSINHNQISYNQSNTPQISVPANSSSLGVSRRQRSGCGIGTDGELDNRNGLLVALQQKLFENYHFVAYTIVICTYFIAFCEYVYLRLISLVFPDRIVYRRPCEKHANETIVRNEVHYASATVVFLVIGIFQLVCFFLLTVSEKWIDVRRTFTHFISMEERLRHELAFSVKRVMFTTVFPTFLVYSMCSSVVICAIFYMVGIRDPVEHVGSQVLLYFFDGCVVMYFLAFPIVCLFFHPDIRCWQKRKRKLQDSASIDRRCTTVETNVYSSHGVILPPSKDSKFEVIQQLQTNKPRHKNDTVLQTPRQQNEIGVVRRERAAKRAASLDYNRGNTIITSSKQDNPNTKKGKRRRLSHPREIVGSTQKIGSSSLERQRNILDESCYQLSADKQQNTTEASQTTLKKEILYDFKKDQPQSFHQRFVDKLGGISGKNISSEKSTDSKNNDSLKKSTTSPHSSLGIGNSGSSVQSLCPPGLQNRLRIDRYRRLSDLTGADEIETQTVTKNNHSEH